MSNPQQNQSRLGYILLAVAVAILLFFYTDELNATDVPVTCYSDEQVERINDDIDRTIRRAYHDGHTQGMMDGYKRIINTVREQCALEDINDIVFKYPEGEIRLTCPVK